MFSATKYLTPQTGQGHATLFPFMANEYVNAFTLEAGASNWSGWNTTSSTQSSSMSFLVLLSAGTYTVKMIGYRGTDTAIITAKIDGATVGTMDMYGAAQYNTIFSITGISVATSGIKTLLFSNATKNGSSTGYRFHTVLFEIYRTA